MRNPSAARMLLISAALVAGALASPVAAGERTVLLEYFNATW